MFAFGQNIVKLNKIFLGNVNSYCFVPWINSEQFYEEYLIPANNGVQQRNNGCVSRKEDNEFPHLPSNLTHTSQQP